MSIANYAELQTAVAAYMHRGDLASMVPTFIDLAEAKLNQRLRLPVQRSTATGSVASSVALPSDFLELISLTVTVSGSTYPVEPISTARVTGESGGTYYFSIVGSNVLFEPVATGATYTLTYFAKFAAVSGSANWLITNAPQCYQYGALIEACMYTKDDAGMARWSAAWQQAISDVESAGRNASTGGRLRMKKA